MTETVAHAINIAILLAMIAASWLLPRAFGLLGLFAAHFCGVVGLASMGFVLLACGIGPPYEPIEMIGYAIQGVVFNVAMLPVSIWAVVRWRRLSPMSTLYGHPSQSDP